MSSEPGGAGERAAYVAGVTEESHRDAMNDAIRAQRERAKVPKSMLPPEDEPAPVQHRGQAPVLREPEPEAVAKKGFLARLLGR